MILLVLANKAVAVKTPSLKFLAILVAGFASIAAIYLVAIRDVKSVEVIALNYTPVERLLAVNGRIRPIRRIELSFPFAGNIVELRYDAGDQVVKGARMASLDTGPELARVAQQQAALASQSARVEKLHKDYSRFQQLGEFVSRRQLEQQRLDLIAAQREYQRLRATLEEARETIARKVLYAPFAGTVTDRPVDLGEAVTPGQVVYRFADLGQLQIAAEVDEIYADEIRPGTAARITTEGLAQPYRARVVRVEPRVDPLTGAREVRLEPLGNLGSLADGQTVTVNFVVERRESAISLPKAAILSQADGKGAVRLVNQDNQVETRAVEYIDWPAEEVIVTKGLEEGERVLRDPLSAEDGEKVRIENRVP